MILLKGGGQMGYSVKWMTEKLGVTRDMLRYYEKENLLKRNPNGGYRDYDNEEVEQIWSIKLLIGIGFSAKEIYAMMNDPNFDFYEAITAKVVELEKKQKEATTYLEVAKSIKFLGRVPTVSELGSVRFEDFMAYVRKNWNFYSDPQAAPYLKLADTFMESKPTEWSSEQLDRVLELVEQIDLEDMQHTLMLSGYYQLIADMKEYGYMDEIVQRVIRLLHEYLMKHNENPELDGEITPQFLAKYMAPVFINGGTAAMYERNYGKDGCMFIAQAIAYYGGYDVDDL